MKFEELLRLVRGEPVFGTELLLCGDVDPGDVRRQLSRWTRSGKVVQLRRGVYVLGEPYRGAPPHPFLVANRLVRGSYVSTESALAHAGLIPEAVPSTTSVCTGRPLTLHTSIGVFSYRHIKLSLFYGYVREPLIDRRSAHVALPEKALLDLVHLVPGADRPAYIDELRLQNLERLDLSRLTRLAEDAGSPKLRRAAAHIAARAREDAEAYETL